MILSQFYSFAEPPHNGNGHGITEGFVAGAVGGGFIAIRHLGPTVGESLQAFALGRGQAAHGVGEYRWVALAWFAAAVVETISHLAGSELAPLIFGNTHCMPACYNAMSILFR